MVKLWVWIGSISILVALYASWKDELEDAWYANLKLIQLEQELKNEREQRKKAEVVLTQVTQDKENLRAATQNMVNMVHQTSGDCGRSFVPPELLEILRRPYNSHEVPLPPNKPITSK